MTSHPRGRTRRRAAGPDDETFLLDIQREAWEYFHCEVNRDNGLVVDKTEPGTPASISAVGLALSCYTVGAQRRYCTRRTAVELTLAALRFFRDSRQDDDATATGWQGFYYHYLDMHTGQRARECELSTIDTALLIAGALTSAAYFDRNNAGEREVRRIADTLYRRVNWRWARLDTNGIAEGWKTECGFLPDPWKGYSEALLLYILALGSPTHPVPATAYAAWTSTYRWKRAYGHDYLYAGPLFIHQLSHVWVDFRGIHDAYMRRKVSDYFENSRRATFVHQAYAAKNPHGWVGYQQDCWGVTASEGLGDVTRRIHGRSRHFHGYSARGVPFGFDDGSVSLWAAVTSLPFAPEIVIAAARHFHDLKLREGNPYGFKATFNATFPHDTGSVGWVSPVHFALNVGPMVLMIENHLSGLIWRLMRGCMYVRSGLTRAGFNGGWLG
jgi:hypothetical protein